MRVSWRGLASGACSALFLLALWWRPTPVPLAEAQGVGIFSRPSCLSMTAPVAGETFCFEGGTNVLKVWDGSRWNAAGSGEAIALQNGVSYRINNFFAPTASGTLNQYGLAASISGTNAGGSIARIALGAHAYTGGGVSSTNQMEAANFVCQQNAADARTPIICLEINTNINGGDDALDPGAGHYALSLVNSGGNISGPTALNISSSSGAANPYRRGILVATASIANYVFDYGGDGTTGPVTITANSILTVATKTTTNAVAGSVVMKNGASLYGVQVGSGGTAQPLIGFSNSNGVVIDLNGNGVAFGDGAGFAGGLTLPSGVTGGNFGTGTMNLASGVVVNGVLAVTATSSGANLTNVNSISKTGRAGANLRGSCTFAAAQTCTSSFASNEPDTSYFVMISVNGNDPIQVQTKAVTGITFFATRAISNTVDWMIVR